MTIFRSLLDEIRTVTSMQWWGQGQDGPDDDAFSGGIHAGVRVTQETALKFSAVWACLRLKSLNVAALPVDTYRTRGDNREPVNPQPAWMRQPSSAIPLSQA